MQAYLDKLGYKTANKQIMDYLHDSLFDDYI